jgi:hypothetical protein
MQRIRRLPASCGEKGRARIVPSRASGRSRAKVEALLTKANLSRDRPPGLGEGLGLTLANVGRVM